MPDKSIVDKRNFDNSFTRKVILGILTYLYEKVGFTQTIDGKDEEVKIPYYYSYTGSQQFLMDFFKDTDNYYKKICEDGHKTEGNTIKVPSGTLKLKSIGINKTFLTSQYARMNISKKEETDFGYMNNNSSVRTNMIPLLYQFDITLITSSFTQQLNVVENTLKELVGVRKFFIGEYEGYKMLPVLMGFPDDYDLSLLMKFNPGDNNQRSTTDFVIEALAYIPRKLAGSEYKFNESITKFKINNES